jgi:hypothetical protein
MTNILYVFGSWNIRGLGQQQKCDDMLTKLISLNPSMLFLQETKLNEIPTLKAKKIPYTTSQTSTSKHRLDQQVAS